MEQSLKPCPTCGLYRGPGDERPCDCNALESKVNEREVLRDPAIPLWKITFECSQWVLKAGIEEQTDDSVGERREVLIACPGGWQAINDVAKAFLSNLEESAMGEGSTFFQPRLIGIERVDQVTVIDLGTLKDVRDTKTWPVEELMSAFLHSTLIE